MAAPKYNLYALGNNGGRPRVFKTPEDLEMKCNEYFEACVRDKMIITITGLCLWLGVTRKTIIRWEKAPEFEEFSKIIKRAVDCVEHAYEMKLDTFTFGGAIFALKNIAKDYWQDKTEQEVKQTVTNVSANFGNTLQSTQEPKEDTR